MLSKEYRVLIKVLRIEKGYGAKRIVTERRHFEQKFQTVRLFKLTAAVFVNRIFGRFYLEFNFSPALRCRPYFAETSHHCLKCMWLSLLKIVYLIRLSFTDGTTKSLEGSLFWTQ